jgi:hypothetical protein
VNLKLFIALLCAGIAVLVGSTALVATLPAARTSSSASDQGAAAPHPRTDGSLPGGWTATSRPGGASSTTTTGKSAITPTAKSSTPSTAFVLVTISYAIEKGDTVSSVERWFDQHGYGTQFAANMQVIEDNENLLVPGAVVSISNGVMTIHSPI